MLHNISVLISSSVYFSSLSALLNFCHLICWFGQIGQSLLFLSNFCFNTYLVDCLVPAYPLSSFIHHAASWMSLQCILLLLQCHLLFWVFIFRTKVVSIQYLNEFQLVFVLYRHGPYIFSITTVLVVVIIGGQTYYQGSSRTPLVMFDIPVSTSCVSAVLSLVLKTNH